MCMTKPEKLNKTKVQKVKFKSNEKMRLSFK